MSRDSDDALSETDVCRLFNCGTVLLLSSSCTYSHNVVACLSSPAMLHGRTQYTARAPSLRSMSFKRALNLREIYQLWELRVRSSYSLSVFGAILHIASENSAKMVVCAFRLAGKFIDFM